MRAEHAMSFSVCHFLCNYFKTEAHEFGFSFQFYTETATLHLWILGGNGFD